MIKKIILVLLIFSFISNCSFDTKSGIWTNNEKIEKNSLIKDKILKYKKLKYWNPKKSNIQNIKNLILN